MENFKAFLFDFDGVLADTMEDNFKAWKKSFQNYNIKIRREDYFPLEGMKLIEVAKTISNKYSVSLDLKEVVNFKNEYYLKNHHLSFYDNVNQLIDFLKNKGKKLAIVSASPRKKLEKTVNKEFLKKFDIIVSGDDTQNGKPSPEPYLFAIKKLGILPKQSIVIENAPLGIKSAKSAGAHCIAIETTLDKLFLSEADYVVKNHKELRNRFLELS